MAETETGGRTDPDLDETTASHDNDAAVVGDAALDEPTLDEPARDEPAIDLRDSTVAGSLPDPGPGQPFPAGPLIAPRHHVAPAPPAPPPEPRQLGWRFFTAVAVGAVAADVVLRRPPWNNVAATLAVVLAAAALLLSGRLQSMASKVAVAMAVVVGSFLWFRTDPVLVFFDLVAVLALGWIAVIHARGPSIWNTGPVRLAARGADSIVLGLETMVDSAAEIGARYREVRESDRVANGVWAGVVRGLLLALPILLVLGLLLASADAVFASFFTFDSGIDVGVVVGHAVLLVVGAVVTVVLLRLSGRELSTIDDKWSGPKLGRVEAMVVLVSLNLLFAAFAAAQLVALTGGAEAVLADAGLTYKQYARQGFFQLLWVAALTALVLIALGSVTRHLGDRRRPVVWASLVSIALTLMVVAVAFGRLQLYVDAEGLTPLRFYSSAFSIWIGVVFLLLAARLLGYRPERAWLTPAVGLSALAFLIGLNVANPERIIAQHDVDRNQWDLLWHMDKLTADGLIVVFDGLDQLDPEIRTETRDQLCTRLSFDEWGFDRSGLGFNLSELRLERRIDQHCP